jgi:hypothetical protein
MHCVTERMSIGMFVVEKNVINDSPEYQRESGVWSPEKQQLFLDSIFNKFDVPKLYLHDLRGKHGKYKFAVIDGKQRLHTIWSFIDGDISLADDFAMFEPEGRTPPATKASFTGLTPDWQEIFKGKLLDVVLVRDASPEDIEELFSRLNNGEPLNAAEKRNALGGDMCQLIREIAKLPFFSAKIPFGNNRYQYYEVAAKMLLIEKSESDTDNPFCDLKKKFLDNLVKSNRKMSAAARDGILKRVSDELKIVSRVFGKDDPLLSKQAAVPLYYLFVKVMNGAYAHATLFSDLRKFLEDFHVKRQQNLQKKEEERDPVLTEFGRLMQQGTNDLNSLMQRVSILRRSFLQEYPDVALRDKKRAYSEEERFAIFVLSGKQCAECKKALKDIDEMEADHQSQWAHGGATTLKNARALCITCNKSLAKKTK